MKKSLLSIAVNGALGLTTVATIISSIPAMAQENTTQVEEILVTGSRIARDPLSTTGPITLLSAEDISRSGVGTIDELLNQLPSMGTTGIGGNDNNGGQGVAFADLRNLGTERTLVLVNGRRYVSSAASNVSGVDLNNIPVDMIERIEVLTDGASAVYGADAVAGVINIVMKDSFEGVRISARAGATGEGDGENGDLSITFGGEGERGQFIANISHSQRNEIAMKDRDWAHVLSSRTPNGNISTKYGQFTVGADGASLTDDHTLYDIGQYMWLSGAMERTSASFSGTFSITDSVEAFGEASYTRKTTNQQMAAQPMATDSGFKINPIVNLSDELQNQLEGKWQKYQDDLPQNQEKWRAENPGKDDSLNPYKPVDSWNGGFNDLLIRPVAGGTRDSEQTTDTYRFLGGLRGDFKNGWNWEAFASYGRNEGEDISTNNYNKAKLKEVLEGKTDIDPVIHGSLSPELIEYFRYTDRADNIYTLSNVGASLTGDIDAITFQGGALGFAAGMEYRREAGRYNPSEETRKGDTFGNQQDGTGGSYTVTEAFAEFNLPILEGARFAEELAVDVAMRYSDFDNFGGQSTGKLGLVYAPIETLRFRASLSNSYRAPGIYELYSGSVQSYEPLIDPCDTRADINKAGQGVNCAIVGTGFKHDTTQIPTNIGGNDKLTPEEATTLTTGLVWTPAFVDDLSITLDYFDIQIDNAIDQPNLQGLLDDCYRKGIA
ncbi:MAG: TonB-dependent receptor, partial [Gammaproteobacteria bacterium]|nr:TonB-dependent receptor [Gammaproteobacteria bacterium]